MTTKPKPAAKTEAKPETKKHINLDELRAAILEIERASSDPAVKEAFSKVFALLDELR